MNSVRILDRRIAYVISAAVLVLVMLVPAIVAAAQVTSRSIELSSSSAAAQNVNYKVGFTAISAAAAFVVEFCSDSPIIGQTCTAPTGFSTAGAASATSGVTNVSKPTANKLVITKAIAANDQVSVDVSGINNPTSAGSLYARIVTYTQVTDANNYTSANLGNNSVDQGGVAISITPTVAVSGAVLESLTFCLSAVALQANCVGASAPTIQLGETVASTKALNAGFVSTGNVFTQLSTNAGSGAVVSLKSNATGCGGLKRAGAPAACDIAPALNSNIIAGEAKFGVKTASAATDTTGAGITPSGVLVASGLYNSSTYALNYVANNSAGVTSPYGDPILNTNSLPVNNKNMQLTFGASISNSTPAGLYSADISLVASGKF